MTREMRKCAGTTLAVLAVAISTAGDSDYPYNVVVASAIVALLIGSYWLHR